MSTFKGGSFSTRSVLSQSKAANSWAYYQAKSVKSYLYELRREEMDLDLAGLGPTASPALLDRYRSTIAEYDKEIRRYVAEKAQVQDVARKLEAIRDDAQVHAQKFGVAVIYLQIAILLSSIAALLRKKAVWLLSLAVGAMGIFHFADGFLLFLG